MSDCWRLINSGIMSGAANMALDEALLQSVAAGDSVPILRLYRWQPATVTLGYGQRGRGVVNLKACAQLGLDVVRRCTGGRAVLHDREMTYAVISKDVSSVFPGGILNNYQVIAKVLQQTLAEFGLDAILAAERSRGSDGSAAERSACFTAPGQFELLCQGKKVAGCAQKRLGDSFLQHGSVPITIDLQQLFQALNADPECDAAAGVRRLAASVGWINNWAAVPVVIEQLEAVFIEQFAQQLGIHFEPSVPTIAEQQLADELLINRYSTDSWNYQGLDGAPG